MALLLFLSTLLTSLAASRGDERGQGLVEYALILVLVAIVVIAVLVLLGPQISGIFCEIAEGIADACEVPCEGECGPT